MIDQLLQIRKQYAYGKQDTYMENEDLMGWVRHGDEKHPGSLAVVVSTGDKGVLPMFVGEDQAGKTYTELTNDNTNEIEINEKGFGEFEVGPGTLSCWAEKIE